MKKKYLIRDFDFPIYLESFIVSSVATIIVIRFFLSLTGYPQVGNGTLHIAHMLWGGLLMMIVILFYLTFLNVAIKKLLAVIGGIGFGVFIDELGKFITNDNDYFFQPTFAILYILFLILFLLLQLYKEFATLSEQEISINDQVRALFDTKNADSNNRIIIKYNSLKSWYSSKISNLVNKRSFKIIIFTLFGFRALGGIVLILLELFSGSIDSGRSAIFVSSYALMILLLIVGLIYTIIGKQLRGLKWIKYSMWVALLVIQIFVFYQNQLTGLTTLFYDIILLTSVNSLINQIESKKD